LSRVSWAVPVLRGVCGGPGRVALGAAVSPEKTFLVTVTVSRAHGTHTRTHTHTYTHTSAASSARRSPDTNTLYNNRCPPP
jgi:hypothetical protein